MTSSQLILYVIFPLVLVVCTSGLVVGVVMRNAKVLGPLFLWVAMLMREVGR